MIKVELFSETYAGNKSYYVSNNGGIVLKTSDAGEARKRYETEVSDVKCIERPVREVIDSIEL